MPIDYDTLKQWDFGEIEHTYTPRDVMLYALGVGYGADPLDADDLAFVYEKALRVAPTMAAVLGYPGFWARDPRTGIDWVKMLHGEQTVRIHRPLPRSGTVIGRSKVARIVDKGAGKGALLLIERGVFDKASGERLATVEQLNFCRGDGGFSAGDGRSDTLPASAPMPEGPPDAVCDLPTRPEAALIYRLSGDDNPLHADPEVARAAGFDRPILHGLATWGVAAHAVLKTCCDSDPERMMLFHARFTKPVFAGESIRTEIWRDGNTVSFRARSIERDVVVLDNGRAELRGPEGA